MNGDAVSAALSALRDQILSNEKPDYDRDAVMRHLQSAIDLIRHERGSALEGDFRTQGGGGNPA